MKEKVVGTTFVEQKNVNELVGTIVAMEESEKGVPEFHTHALLMPELTNPYDPTAIAVYVKLQNGDAHRVGYLARQSPMKAKLQNASKDAFLKKMVIYGYSKIGLTDSYVLVDGE